MTPHHPARSTCAFPAETRITNPQGSPFAERAAAFLGISGAVLNAFGLAALSYWIWLPGNVAGLLFGIAHYRRTGRRSIAIMFAAYVIVSLVGLFTWSM